MLWNRRKVIAGILTVLTPVLIVGLVWMHHEPSPAFFAGVGVGLLIALWLYWLHEPAQVNLHRDIENFYGVETPEVELEAEDDPYQLPDPLDNNDYYESLYKSIVEIPNEGERIRMLRAYGAHPVHAYKDAKGKLFGGETVNGELIEVAPILKVSPNWISNVA